MHQISADALLARAADVTFLLDIEETVSVRRWYDPAHSKLALPGEAEMAELVHWVHPDDLLEVLEAFAAVVNGRPTRSAVARIHPERDVADEAVLLIRIQDVRDLTGRCALIQAWVAEDESIIRRQFDPSTSLSSLAAAAPVGLQVLGPQGKVSFENECFTRLAEPARADIEACIAEGIRDHDVVTHDLAAGDAWLRLRLVPTLDEGGRLVLAVASLEDVTQVQAAEAGRVHAVQLFEAVFDSSPVATALVGLDGTFERANDSFGLVTGYSVSELLAMRFQDITHPADLAADEELLAEVVAGARRSYQMEKRYLHRAGHEVWVELTVAPVLGPSGRVEHFVSHVEDITSRRSAVELGDADDLTYWATHDHLTALPNRRFVEHHLQVSLARARRTDDMRPVVMFLDLDDFKPVNDLHGHVVGDEVLQTIARRLRSACRDDAVVARYGGDEFLVVARQLRDALDVPLLAERLVDAVRAPVTSSDGAEVTVGVSVGISVARPGEVAPDVIARADKAAYAAKHDGKDRAYFAD
jgi:diguanylate cyclase (GGDEF)-like protein/PAS domain S-box-containing protein